MRKWLQNKFTDFWIKPVVRGRPALSQFDTISHELRPGDVILLEGISRAALMVKKLTQSPWTHVGLYIGRLHDIDSEADRARIIEHYNPGPQDQMIIETVLGKGSYIDDLSEYKDKHIRVCRPIGISHHDVQQVIHYALNHIGGKYHTRHFFELGRYLLMGKYIPRKWSSALYKKKSNKAMEEICSAMIAKAFMSVQFPLLPTIRANSDNNPNNLEIIHRNPNLFIPADFDYSPYFKILKYPKFHVNQSPLYHHMPWNDAYVVNDRDGLASTTLHGSEHEHPEIAKPIVTSTKPIIDTAQSIKVQLDESHTESN